MATCTDISLFWDATTIWWSGTKLDGYCILGWSAVSLGRIAKLVALIASIPLLIDLVGEERVHKTAFALSKNLQRWLDRLSQLLDLFEKRGLLGITDAIGRSKLAQMIILFPFILLTLYFYIGLHRFGLGKVLMSFAIGWLAINALGVLLFILIGTAFAAFVAFLQCAVLALRRPVLCWYVRLISAFLLLISFAMDIFISS